MTDIYTNAGEKLNNPNESKSKSMPWYDGVTNMLDKFDIKCKLNGPMHVYNEKGLQNPYSYGSSQVLAAKRQFNERERASKAHPLRRDNCVVRNGVSSEKDKYGRYHLHPKNKFECENTLHGVWDADSMNRSNRYRRGVCWADQETASCAAHVGNELVLPAKESTVAKREEVLKKSQGSCNADMRCAWVPMTNNGKDCFSKAKLATRKMATASAAASASAASSSPKNMPVDITEKDVNIQGFMNDYYKSPLAPKVGVLEGTGNRCVKPTAAVATAAANAANASNASNASNATAVDAKKHDIKREYSIDELKMFKIPLSVLDRRIFVAAFGQKQVVRLEKSAEYRIGRISDDNLIWKEIPYYWADYIIQDEVDDEEKEAVVSEFLPSLPQSVVNMVMKNISTSGSSNKGMMAWHSTGSGKTCTAAGVMDAFWDSDKQIVFASSINAIASNPDSTFHECAARLYPRFKEEPFGGDMGTIASKFAERGIIFISFAKLANRIQKTETFKKLIGVVGTKGKKQRHSGGRVAAAAKAAAKPKAKPKAKPATKGKAKKPVYDDDEEDDEEDEPVVRKGKAKVVAKAKPKPKGKAKKPVYDDDEEDDEEDEPVVRKGKAKVVAKAKPKPKGKAKKPVYDDDEEEEEEEDDDEPVVRKTKGKAKKQIEESDDDDEHVVRNSRKHSHMPVSKAMIEDPFLNRIAKWYGMEDDLGGVKDALRQSNIAGVEDFVDLDHTVLIIDEVHNLFRPLAAQKEKHNFVEKHIVDPLLHPDLKVVILTATPGDNVKDVLKLLNIVRDPTKPAITAPDADNAADVLRFKESIRGLVSYFEMSNDTTKFPTVRDTGPVMYPMSPTQFSKYFEAYQATKADAKDYDGLAKQNQLGKFWAGARKYSNMLFTLEKSMQMTEFSSKMQPLLDGIKLYDTDKHYVYSAFYEKRGSGQGILAIGAELEKAGYEKITWKEAKEFNRKGISPPVKKRYMLALQSEIGEEGSNAAGKNLKELTKIYNSAENKTGELIHVFLASQSFNEGLDLKAVKHIHIFEPLVTMASDLQTIGRARRYCSHADLDLKDWTVDIHRYLTDLPIDIKGSSAAGNARMRIAALKASIETFKDQLKDTDKSDGDAKLTLKDSIAEKTKELKGVEADVKKLEKSDVSKVKSIDLVVYNEAQNRMRALFVTYHCMKEAAIDCLMLHKFHGDNSITCMAT